MKGNFEFLAAKAAQEATISLRGCVILQCKDAKSSLDVSRRLNE
jgi:hypothetical protein